MMSERFIMNRNIRIFLLIFESCHQTNRIKVSLSTPNLFNQLNIIHSLSSNLSSNKLRFQTRKKIYNKKVENNSDRQIFKTRKLVKFYAMRFQFPSILPKFGLIPLGQKTLPSFPPFLPTLVSIGKSNFTSFISVILQYGKPK